ncbi:hypothetical protein CPB84DRAFT_1767427 [Gymnopilus junonius]|uniref:RING-type domain-containing protein n=1 Tax=Gymnopilus junonius TaxID=109634 RepID=A0A9P5TRX4_GYMJU|nr:hypothetical protein CPB84DRAFT_1767427 [Gymnopilus junonius]
MEERGGASGEVGVQGAAMRDAASSSLSPSSGDGGAVSTSGSTSAMPQSAFHRYPRDEQQQQPQQQHRQAQNYHRHRPPRRPFSPDTVNETMQSDDNDTETENENEDEWAFYDNLNMFTAALIATTTVTTTTTAFHSESDNNGSSGSNTSTPIPASTSTSAAAAAQVITPRLDPDLNQRQSHLIFIHLVLFTFHSQYGVGSASGAHAASSARATAVSPPPPLALSSSSLFANPNLNAIPNADLNLDSDADAAELNREMGRFYQRSPPTLLSRSQHEHDGLTFASLIANPASSPSPSSASPQITERSGQYQGQEQTQTQNPSHTRNQSTWYYSPTPMTSSVAFTSAQQQQQNSFSSFLSFDSLFGSPTPPLPLAADSGSASASASGTGRAATATAAASSSSDWRFRPSSSYATSNSNPHSNSDLGMTPTNTMLSNVNANTSPSVNSHANRTSPPLPAVTRISPPEPMSPLWPWDPPVSGSAYTPPSSSSRAPTSSSASIFSQQQQQRADHAPPSSASTSSSTTSATTTNLTPGLLRPRSMRSMPPFAPSSSSSTRTRLGPSTSLVTENAVEIRRRADHAETEMLARERERERDEFRARMRTMDLDLRLGSGQAESEESESSGLDWSTGAGNNASAATGSGNGMSASASANTSSGARHHSRTHTLGEFIDERLRELNNRSIVDPAPYGSGSSSGLGRFRMLPPTSTRERENDRDSVLDSASPGHRRRWWLPMPSTTSAGSTSATAGPSSTSDMTMGGGEIDFFATSRRSTLDPPSPLDMTFTTVAGAESSGAQAQADGPSSMDSPELEFLGPWSVYGGERNQATNGTHSANSSSTPTWLSNLGMMEGVVDNSTPDGSSRVPPTLPPPDLGGNLGGTFDLNHPATATAAADMPSSTSNPFSLRDIDMRYENAADESDDMEIEFLSSSRAPRTVDSSTEMPLKTDRERERRFGDTRREERERDRREALESERMRLRLGLRLRAQAQDQDPVEAQNTGGSGWNSSATTTADHDSADRERADHERHQRLNREEFRRHQNMSNGDSSTSSAPNRRLQSFAQFDPESFTPGPFRNTMLHFRNTMASQQIPTSFPPPPSIPPLSFGDNSFLRDRPAGGTSQQSSSVSPSSPGYDTAQMPRHEAATLSAAAGTTRPGGPRNPASQPARLFPRSFASARAANQLSNSNMNNESSASRGGGSVSRGDLHNFMTRHVRMEPSRVDDDLGGGSPMSQFRTGRRQAPGQRPGNLEPLRPDGRNSSTRQAQIIEQFRREHGVRDPEGTGAPHPYPHRHQPPPQSRRPFVPAYARRGSLFGLTFDDGDGSPARNESNSNSENPPSLSARRQHVEASNTDTSAPSIATASRRRFMMMFARGFRGADLSRDEDFDESYEGLLSLSQTLGDVKPRATPSQYKDWATPDSDKRCPICLDDYGETDTVLKLPNCSHWLHQDCLHQWLANANTCPVCRKSAITPSSSSSGSPSARRSRTVLHHHHHHHVHPLRPHLAQHMQPGPANAQPRPLPQAQPPRNPFGMLRRSSLLGPRPSNGGAGGASSSNSNNNSSNGRGPGFSSAGQNQGNADDADANGTYPGGAPSGSSGNFW